MSEESVSRDEARIASTLFYGLMGGFAGSGSCCCWPVSIGIAWLATRRAVDRGIIEPGKGIGYGLGLGVVMGLVMSSLGTALALSNLEEPQGEMIAAMLADTPLWLLAAVVVAMLGGIGLGSGLLGGLLGGGGRPSPQGPASSSVVVRPDVPVPGAVHRAEFTEDAEERSLNPEDFVTAVSDPDASSWASPEVQAVTDVERTVSIDPEESEGGEGLEGTEDREAPEED